MSNTAIRVRDLGKRYHIGVRERRHDTMRDLIVDSATMPFRRLAKLVGGHAAGAADLDETFWALRDVSFDVKHGEVLGVIGRNGAGKSTLLKILSRITHPDAGEADINGRLGSLLEVGTAFHPELTGRENVFLNGAVLGMRRHEIERKFDAIVDFSGVEKFLDTPVKHFSSGMAVRLAFAVAAHLDPEILIIDEVLAVGDAAFQKKCLAKMDEVTRAGRTVLFVSHNMSAVDELCDRILFLVDGKVKSDGPTSEVISEYLNYGDRSTIGPDGELSNYPRSGALAPVIVRGEVNGKPMQEHHLVRPLEPLQMAFEVEVDRPMREFALAVYFMSVHALCVFATNTIWSRGPIDLDRAGRHRVECTIPRMPLVAGPYFLIVAAAAEGKALDKLEQVSCIEVAKTDPFGHGRLPGKGEGHFLSDATWTVNEGSGVS
ncbi:MAG: ATP-binding cassette domain-containing protein [bacterium]|nr:ATP-binding cassette domain-containing protein [bacterium]